MPSWSTPLVETSDQAEDARPPSERATLAARWKAIAASVASVCTVTATAVDAARRLLEAIHG
jgi:hypothetical protein